MTKLSKRKLGGCSPVCGNVTGTGFGGAAFGQTNIDSGLAASPYHEIGTDRALAKIKTSFLSEFAAGIIRAECPNLKDKMHVRNAVINWQSRVLEVIDTSGAW